MKKLAIILCWFGCFTVYGQDQKGLLNEKFNNNKLNWTVVSDASVNWKVENV